MVSEEIDDIEKWNGLGFLSDRSKSLSIEIIDSNKVELLEAIMFAPRKLIALKILYQLIYEDLGLIRAERILTDDEEEELEQFEKEYKTAMKYLDYNIKQYRKEVYYREKRREEEERESESD
ncbi:MAG: hypothetical protein ACFFDB_00295 [Promethearchaeota archaeon]